MNRLLLAILIPSLPLLGSDLRAQETAKVQITVKVSAKTPSFQDHRLVVILYHNNPGQEDAGDVAIARHIDAKFSHEKGKDTVVTLTLGEKSKRKQGVLYTFNATVFNEGSKITHAGEMQGRTGPFALFTSASDRKATVILSPAR